MFFILTFQGLHRGLHRQPPCRAAAGEIPAAAGRCGRGDWMCREDSAETQGWAQRGRQAPHRGSGGAPEHPGQGEWRKNPEGRRTAVLFCLFRLFIFTWSLLKCFCMKISWEINCVRRTWFSLCWRGGRFSALDKRGEKVVHGRKREKAEVECSSQELIFKQQMQHKVECIVSIFHFCFRLKRLCRSTIVPNTICPALKWRQRSWSRGLRKQPPNLWKQLSSSGTLSAPGGVWVTRGGHKDWVLSSIKTLLLERER